MAEFVTSDLHFGDTSMLGCGFIRRPFPDRMAMDRALIDNWNDVVRANDTVYVLGDVFGEKTWPKRRFTVFGWLNGRKVLILGNHDKTDTKRLSWVGVHKQLAIEREGIMFHMRHYPPANALVGPGTVHLHGHLHTTETSMPIYDVGVDANGFRPIPMQLLVDKAVEYQSRLARLGSL